ncbi:MAG: methyltransferase domain-containing protein [Nannocystaceae bacterium]
MITRLQGRSAAHVRVPSSAERFASAPWRQWADHGLRLPAAADIARSGPFEVTLQTHDGAVLLPATLAEWDGPDAIVRFTALAHALVEDFARAPDLEAGLGDDPFVVLDPSVTVEPDRKETMHLLLCGAFDTTMVVPEGDGLLDLVEGLREPVPVSELVEGYDDQALVLAVIDNLAAGGLLHRMPESSPDVPDFSHLRHRRAPHLRGRQRVRLEERLDAVGDVAGLLERVGDRPVPAVLVLHGAELSPYHGLFRELAEARREGALRLHDLVISTTDEGVAPAVAASLFQLGARIYLGPGPRWVEPTPSEASLLAAGVSVLRRVWLSPAELLEPPLLEQLAQRMQDARLAGASIEMPLQEASLSPEIIEGCVREVGQLNLRLGDVELADLASDEEVLGNEPARSGTLAERGEPPGSKLGQLRHAHLRAVSRKLRKRENRVLWAQVPEAEELWVKAAEDLLPNAPGLLGLEPGCTVVDMCGGMGRVARRLEPSVGPRGTIVSIEREDLIVHRARRFVAQAGLGNVQFRKGLAQRVALPDGFADAVVNEWTGAVWQLGLGPAMLREMARVVRPGGRVAVTHRLVVLRLDDLLHPRSMIPNIYRMVMDAFAATDLEIVEQRVWGQTLPQFYGAPLRWLVEEYLPRIYDLLGGTYDKRASDRADTYLTVIARRPA